MPPAAGDRTGIGTVESNKRSESEVSVISGSILCDLQTRCTMSIYACTSFGFIGTSGLYQISPQPSRAGSRSRSAHEYSPRNQ